MAASTDFSQGITLARSEFAQMDKRGNKWKTRNVPVFIRQRLWKPYYLTEKLGEPELYIIQPPGEVDEKVHFIRWEPPSP